MPRQPPKVTEAQIRRGAGKGVFERGVAYYRAGRVQGPQVEENEVRGQVFGQRDRPYRVRVRVERGRPRPECTCPYGDFCKHAVALLLLWVHRPGEFTRVESLRDRLRGMEKEELVDLVVQVARRDPGLVPPGRQRRVSPASMKREVVQAFDRHSDRYGMVTEDRALDLVDSLDLVYQRAGELGKQGRPADAARVLQVLFTTCIENIERLMGGYMSFNGLVSMSIEECGRWVRRSKAPADGAVLRGVLGLLLGPGSSYGFDDELEELLVRLWASGSREVVQRAIEAEFKRRASRGSPQGARAGEALQRLERLQESLRRGPKPRPPGRRGRRRFR